MPGSTTASQEIAAFCAAFTSSEYFNLSPGRALIWDLTPRTRRLICDLQTPRSSAAAFWEMNSRMTSPLSLTWQMALVVCGELGAGELLAD